MGVIVAGFLLNPCNTLEIREHVFDQFFFARGGPDGCSCNTLQGEANMNGMTAFS